MKPTWQSPCGSATLYEGDCVEHLRTLPGASVDCCITDPPYPEISRDYGRMSEPQWHDMMDVVVPEVRRILKPTGSAVFVLQPNSERVGRMRSWLWEFMAKWTREWGMVQDAWWWNFTAPPTVHVQRTRGGLRPSVKPCVWLGPENCFKDQDAILWSESDANKAIKASGRCTNRLAYSPAGYSMRETRARGVAEERGGTTPFNLLPMAGRSASKGDDNEHGARTPDALADWWLRYICPPGGTVLDPFIGSGTVGLAAIERGCKAIGIEKMPKYFETARSRIEAALKAERQLELIA